MKKSFLTLAFTLLTLTTFAQRETLFKHCANDLSYSELNLMADLSTITLNGAKLIGERCGPDVLSIEPIVPRVAIKGMSSSTGKDTSITFRVRNAPAPQYTLLFNGEPISEDNMPQTGETIRFELQADSAFAADHPEDAHYEFEGVETWVNFALSVPQKVGSSNYASDGFEVKASENILKNGYFTLTELTHINYKGERHKVSVPQNQLTFRLKDALSPQ